VNKTVRIFPRGSQRQSAAVQSPCKSCGPANESQIDI